MSSVSFFNSSSLLSFSGVLVVSLLLVVKDILFFTAPVSFFHGVLGGLFVCSLGGGAVLAGLFSPWADFRRGGLQIILLFLHNSRLDVDM